MSDVDFIWAAGIEDTFIPQVHRRTGRILDEYELTQHYRFWREDLERVAALGVRHLRYGIPWYRVNPAPGRFDWSWPDEVLPYMVERLGIQPIIDLVHYGCPLWLEREFISPAYPERVAEYAGAFVERYRDLVRLYTPLNEPRVNAHFCGRIGLWPPYLRGWRGYVRLMMAIARGMSLTVEAIRSRQPGAVIVHVEAGSSIEAEDRALGPELEVRLNQQFLAADLIAGRVDEAHPLWAWLLGRGAALEDLQWLHGRPQAIDIAGINFYPAFNAWRLVGTPDRPRRRNRRGTGEDLEAVLAWHHRRTGVPVMVTETSHVASAAARGRWMDESVAAVSRARAGGVPVVGYTWFPVFSLVVWAYRRGGKPVAEYLGHMGLWDLRDDGTGKLSREPTQLVQRYAALAAAGSAAIGPLGEVRVPATATDRGGPERRLEPEGAAVTGPGGVYTPAASIPARPARPT